MQNIKLLIELCEAEKRQDTEEVLELSKILTLQGVDETVQNKVAALAYLDEIDKERIKEIYREYHYLIVD